MFCGVETRVMGGDGADKQKKQPKRLRTTFEIDNKAAAHSSVQLRVLGLDFITTGVDRRENLLQSGVPSGNHLFG